MKRFRRTAIDSDAPNGYTVVLYVTRAGIRHAVGMYRDDATAAACRVTVDRIPTLRGARTAAPRWH